MRRPDRTTLFIVAIAAVFVWLLLDAGCGDAADPVEMALAELRAEKAVKAAIGKPKDAPSPAARVVIVPGRWEYGADGVWRFYPESQAPTPRGPVGTAVDGRYGSGVPDPRPFVQAPTGGSTQTTLAPFAGGPSTSSPAPVRGPVRTGMFALPGIRGGTNCTSYG
jgi:hypothetical protein